MTFVWILVLSPWAGLLVLILDDVTKEDAGGGAVRVAAKGLGAVLDRTARKAWKLSKALNQAISPRRASKQPVEMATENRSLSSEPVLQPPLKKRKSELNGGRVLSTIPDLESAITEAVRTASPKCQTFVGVVLEQTKPKSRREVNWRLRGVKFGQADRNIASKALTSTIERMQREFYLAER
jgi:hypothetical protein